jgi:20S proteasome alpha/beta subunit
MTIVAGFPGKTFAVLASDSESTTAVTKGTVQKIAIIASSNGECKCVVSGAGNGEFIDFAIQEIRSQLQPHTALERFRAQIEGIVSSMYRKRIDRLPLRDRDNAEFVLLCALWVPEKGVELVKVSRAVSLVLTQPIAIGSGSYLANYLIATLYQPDLQERHYTRLATYLVTQVKAHAPYCGGTTNVVVLRDDGYASEVPRSVLGVDEKSCEIVMNQVGMMLRWLDPLGWSWDLSKLDRVMDNAARGIKEQIRTEFGALAEHIRQSDSTVPVQLASSDPQTPEEDSPNSPVQH